MRMMKQMEEATMYLDKIPKGTQYHEIRNLLWNSQGVRRIFLSNKRKRSMFAFGFVEFYRGAQMQRAVGDMQGKKIQGCPIVARPAYKPIAKGTVERTMPNFNRRLVRPEERRQDQYLRNDLRQWIEHSRREMSHMQNEIFEQNEQGVGLNINVKPSQDWRRKLFKSIVIELKTPMVIQDIKEEVSSIWENWEEMMPLSKRKFLVVFRSEFDCAVARSKLEQMNKDLAFFTSWCGNKTHIQNPERLAWIELVGLPLLAWEQQNIYKIAEMFGKPMKIVMGEDSGNFEMEVGALVRTKTQDRIDRVVKLKVDDGDEYTMNILERCMGKEWRKEEFIGQKLDRQDRIPRQEWPNVSVVYSSNHGLGDPHGRDDCENVIREEPPGISPSFAEVARGGENDQQEIVMQNRRLMNPNIENVQDNSSTQSIDLNRSPRVKHLLDLDPNMFRSEHVVETQAFSNPRDLSSERGEHVSETPPFNQNDGGEMGTNLEVISTAEDDVELARLIKLQLGQVDILTSELRQGIEKRDSLPILWEVEEQSEEEEVDQDVIEEHVEEVKTRKGKGKSKSLKKAKKKKDKMVYHENIMSREEWEDGCGTSNIMA